MQEKEAKLDLSTVVVIADIVSDETEERSSEWRHDLEKSSLGTVAAITQAIESLGISALHLSSLDALTERASQRFPGDVVLSIFGGERSRNRMALVPAICESFDMRFIGPDVYGRVVCQDKEISKMLASQCGMITPWHRIVRNETDLDRLGSVPFPVVVKPNMEGSSIGISERCRVEDSAQMQEIARELLREFNQPVLVEKFVGGREVSVNVIEACDGMEMRFAEIKIAGHPHYFEGHLFGMEAKAPWIGLEVTPLDEKIAEQDIGAISRLLETVGHVGYCRIDGKLFNGRFHFLELTPDAWLDPEGAFAQSFTYCGWSYSQVLRSILASESVNHRRPASNG
ncbi:D-alanine--D-alanine ligase [Pseudothauera nasutitermitis]|uniref:D-alanine--D-alanine ligase n=1 Tax=Pseudothauera nasutitermitis TaxID=2565930 RepID=A0A4S4AM03_9RHOO|nr:D-alanine--D-alanine ligase [Pseudothauera nasutitermitis]THF60555.1 D-alanine--D-alanine ligase [Pseudothauera nasutitermitis]